jgi:RNA methyltransferase, TrmH family
MTAIASMRLRLAQPGVVRLDGLHAVKHAYRFGATELVAVSTNLQATLALARELAPDILEWISDNVDEVTTAELGSIVDRPIPTGVVGCAVKPEAVDVACFGVDDRPLVVLENPRHLGNIGAVVRVAAAADACAVVTTGTVDPWHPQCISGAAGLHFALPVLRVDEMVALRATGKKIVALHPDGPVISAQSIAPGSALVFGTERGGLSPDALGLVDSIVSLPMRAGVSSLNLATSVAATLYLLRAAR